MKILKKIIFASSLFGLQSLAQDFEVIQSIKGCKYFVAEQAYDYILVEDWMCFRPSKGDKGTGKLDGYGMKKVTLGGLKCEVYVDDYMLSKSRASEKLSDKCQ